MTATTVSGTSYTIGVVVGLVVCIVCVVRPALRDAPRLPPRRRLRLLWEPRDLWVGVYRDPPRTFICLLPCVVLLLEPREHSTEPKG